MWEAFLPTLSLVTASLIVGVLLAVPSGIVAAMRKDSAWDWGSMGFAIFVYSMPSFWKGIVLIWIFSVYLGWFPAVGYVHPWEDFWNGMWRLVLPAVTLGTFFSGLVARIIRSSLLEVLDQDYIKAARARGVRRAALVYHHALQRPDHGPDPSPSPPCGGTRRRIPPPARVPPQVKGPAPGRECRLCWLCTRSPVP